MDTEQYLRDVLLMSASSQSNVTRKPTHSNDENIRPTDSSLEVIDPTPNIHDLFMMFNKQFFEGKLDGVEVHWAPGMKVCAGVCRYEGRGGLCSIGLSKPLLKFRPRSDLVETLLHEMIHAYLFVAEGNREREEHGPNFIYHMNRINKIAKTNITIYHKFYNEVDLYRQHWWRCDGPCRTKVPFYGIVKRTMNRAPGPNDFWYEKHQKDCGGTFIKIKEPEGFKPRKRKGETGNTNNSTQEIKKPRPQTNTLDKCGYFTGAGHTLGGSVSKPKHVPNSFPSISNNAINVSTPKTAPNNINKPMNVTSPKISAVKKKPSLVYDFSDDDDAVILTKGSSQEIKKPLPQTNTLDKFKYFTGAGHTLGGSVSESKHVRNSSPSNSNNAINVSTPKTAPHNIKKPMNVSTPKISAVKKKPSLVYDFSDDDDAVIVTKVNVPKQTTLDDFVSSLTSKSTPSTSTNGKTSTSIRYITCAWCGNNFPEDEHCACLEESWSNVPSEEFFPCPVCQELLPMSQINAHLDHCLN